MDEMVNPCYCCDSWFADYELAWHRGHLFCADCLADMLEVEELLEEAVLHNWRLEGF